MEMEEEDDLRARGQISASLKPNTADSVYYSAIGGLLCKHSASLDPETWATRFRNKLGK